MPHLDYFLHVDTTLLKSFTDNETSSSYKHQKVGDTYFKYRKSRIDGVDKVRMNYAEELYERVMEAINDAGEELIEIWYRDVPHYFYRTEKGKFGSMLESGDYLGDSVKHIEKMATKFKGKAGGSSGRLRSALYIHDIGLMGAQLAIKELFNGGWDYVALLKSGAGPNSYAPYDPKRGIRLPHTPGSWGGFPRSYWGSWDAHFKRELRGVEADLNHRIVAIVRDIERDEARDLSKIRRGTTEDVPGTVKAKTDVKKAERKDKQVNTPKRK